jgi:hypothetical protein
VRVIPQGYDTDLYADAGVPVAGEGDPVRVCHTGTFYHGLRDPWQFFEAVRPFDPQDWTILFVGDTEALDQSRLRHVPRAVDLLRHRSVAECAELQKSGSLLLQFAHHSNQQVPGKLFEHFAARRPVLVVASVPDGPASRIVAPSRRGWVVRNESGAIRKELEALQRLHLCGRLEEGLGISSVPEFRWERRCELLEGLLEAVSANGCEDQATRRMQRSLASIRSQPGASGCLIGDEPLLEDEPEMLRRKRACSGFDRFPQKPFLVRVSFAPLGEEIFKT